jgi:hypothetical protein
VRSQTFRRCFAYFVVSYVTFGLVVWLRTLVKRSVRRFAGVGVMRGATLVTPRAQFNRYTTPHRTTRTRLYRTASSPPPPLQLCRTPTAREWFVMETAQSLRRRPWGICKWRSADCSRPPQPSPCAAPRARRAAMALDQTSAAFRDASPPVTTQPWSASRPIFLSHTQLLFDLACLCRSLEDQARWDLQKGRHRPCLVLRR